MMTSTFKIVVKGVQFLPIYYTSRIHSVCHPQAEKSKVNRSKKLTNINLNLEKKLTKLLEQMNLVGIKLFTDAEERVRKNIPVIEKKMTKFIGSCM